jgi:hypothetical protein
VVLAASLVAHVVVLSTLSAVPSKTAIARLNAIDITFSVTAPPPREAPVPPVTAPSPDPTKPALAKRSKRSRQPVSPDRPTLVETSAPPAAPSKAEPVPNLDPESAARAFVIFQQPAPSAAETEAPNHFEGVGNKHYLSLREPPKLQPRQDGTYHFKGHAFKAIVEQDGSVTFDEGYQQGATIAFDLSDRLMRRRGEDPYRVEKRWFMEGTEEFRQQLFERWRAKQTMIALRKLRGRLLRISEDGTLNDRQKAARVVAMFQDTADDEAGGAARTTIAEFVANRMPTVALPSRVH